MGKLRIELKSDLCVSNGDSYNTMLDGDVCYDKYGLPYIPAKRLKGCLREAAEELRHMEFPADRPGFQIHVEEIFGSGDSGALILSNARLVEEGEDQKTYHYEDFISDLLLAKDSGGQEFHQQQVVSMFTYIRKMTKLNQYGSAEDTSLRTLRVLKHGLVFEADVDIDMRVVKKEKETCFGQLRTELELCCKALRHMGIHRTRGMGEVAVSVSGLEEAVPKDSGSKLSGDGDGNAVGKLDYVFRLRGPAAVKNIENGISKTQDYLDGSKIIGILAGKIPQETLLEILNDRYTIFSNAYISDENWRRFTPVPASFRKYKDTKGDTFIDHVSVTDLNREKIEGQLSALDKFYVFRKNSDTYSYLKKEVLTEIRYHHARAADKGLGSIGDDGEFYQVGSICEGQSFQGFIFARNKYLKIIEDAFGQETDCRIGNMKNSEYGSALLCVKPAGKEESTILRIRPDSGSEKTGPSVSGKFAVKLNAPVIMYNKNGMYSTNESDFEQLVKDLLADDSVKLDSSYKKYAMTGGFNSTWKMPKPVLSVLDKGSVFIFQTDNLSNAVAERTVTFVGERITEGYGELEFYHILDDFNGTLDCQEDQEVSAADAYQTSIIPGLARMILKNHCRSKGQFLADRYFGTKETNPKAAVILKVTNQLLHSLREDESLKKENILDGLKRNAENYKIEEKKTIAGQILKDIEESAAELENPSIQWARAQYQNDGVQPSAGTVYGYWKITCLKFMLEQLKYKCTEQIKKTRNGGGGDGI